MSKTKIWYEVFCRRCGTFGATKKSKKLGVTKCRKGFDDCPILRKKSCNG